MLRMRLRVRQCGQPGSWRLAVGSVAGARRCCATRWLRSTVLGLPADTKEEQQVQDRLRLIEVTLRAQMCKAKETGYDVH